MLRDHEFIYREKISGASGTVIRFVSRLSLSFRKFTTMALLKLTIPRYDETSGAIIRYR